MIVQMARSARKKCGFRNGRGCADQMFAMLTAQDFPPLLVGPDDLPRKAFVVGRANLFILAMQIYLQLLTTLYKRLGKHLVFSLPSMP